MRFMYRSMHLLRRSDREQVIVNFEAPRGSRVAHMHHCSHIVEVAEEICEHVFMLTVGSASLLALGLTCRVLPEPAVDRLWKTQPNLSPLTRVLPSDSWEYSTEYFDKEIGSIVMQFVPN